jgi:hypothetical protein
LLIIKTKKLELHGVIKPELNENKGYRFFEMLPHFFLSQLPLNSNSCDLRPSQITLEPRG